MAGRGGETDDHRLLPDCPFDGKSFNDKVDMINNDDFDDKKVMGTATYGSLDTYEVLQNRARVPSRLTTSVAAIVPCCKIGDDACCRLYKEVDLDICTPEPDDDYAGAVFPIDVGRIRTLDSFPPCCGNPYREEATIGVRSATGFVVFNNKILTSSHLLYARKRMTMCAVFDWLGSVGGMFPTVIPDENVYLLKLQARSRAADWALFSVAQRAQDFKKKHKPIPTASGLGSKRALSLYTLSFPWGTTLKLTSGGKVIEKVKKKRFSYHVSLDVTSGFSGAPVLTHVEGKDYVVGMILKSGVLRHPECNGSKCSAIPSCTETDCRDEYRSIVRTIPRILKQAKLPPVDVVF